MAKPKWEMVTPVLSTEHLDKDTLSFLNSRDSAYCAYKIPGGWLVYVGLDDAESWPTLSCMGRVVSWLRKEYGADGLWVRFDQDGDTVEDLPVYDMDEDSVMVEGNDVDILPLSEISNPMLRDAIHAQGYSIVAVEVDGTVHGFSTEDDALLFQRGYRAANGLDQWTGEKA